MADGVCQPPMFCSYIRFPYIEFNWRYEYTTHRHSHSHQPSRRYCWRRRRHYCCATSIRLLPVIICYYWCQLVIIYCPLIHSLISLFVSNSLSSTQYHRNNDQLLIIEEQIVIDNHLQTFNSLCIFCMLFFARKFLFYSISQYRTLALFIPTYFSRFLSSAGNKILQKWPTNKYKQFLFFSHFCF